MNTDTMLIAAMAFVALFVLSLRTNVSLAIMGLCAGYVFSDLLSDDLIAFVYNNNYNQGSVPVTTVVSVGLIAIPAILILFRFRKFQRGRLFQQLLPSIGFSLLLAVLIFNNLSIDADKKLQENSEIYKQFLQFDVLIPVAVVGLAIIDVLLHENERKRHYKKHKKRFAPEG